MADIEIYTDGSGYVNGFGGWAAFIATPDRILKDFRMGSSSGTSVDRMEFTAFLEGLQGAKEMCDRLPQAHLEKWIPHVLWYTDRESLLNSVKNLNKRENCPDLWYRFDYFEYRFKIEPKFMTDELVENSVEFREVDLQSSAGYQQIKNYLEGFPFSPKFKMQI